MIPSTSAFVRRIGAIVLGTAAILVVLLAGPSSTPVDVEANDRALASAQASYRTNDARTSGAPQQEVVNGWFARDALTIQIAQLNDLIGQGNNQDNDPRLALLGLIGILGLCLMLATTPTATTDLQSVGEDRGADVLLPPPPASSTTAVEVDGSDQLRTNGDVTN